MKMTLLCYPNCPRLGLDFPQFDHTDGLDASVNFNNAAGTLFPIALCVQKFSAEPPIKCLYIGIVSRLSGVPGVLIGPVAVCCRSFDSIYCNKGDELWD